MGSSVLNMGRETRLIKPVCLKNRASLCNFGFPLQFFGVFRILCGNHGVGSYPVFLKTLQKMNPFSIDCIKSYHHLYTFFAEFGKFLLLAGGSTVDLKLKKQ